MKRTFVVLVAALSVGVAVPPAHAEQVRVCRWTNPGGKVFVRFQSQGERVPKHFVCGAWSPN